MNGSRSSSIHVQDSWLRRANFGTQLRLRSHIDRERCSFIVHGIYLLSATYRFLVKILLSDSVNVRIVLGMTKILVGNTHL